MHPRDHTNPGSPGRVTTTGDGNSTESDWDPEALNDIPKILWQLKVGMGYSNVAIKGDYLYTMGYRQGEVAVLCLDAETGEEIWKYSHRGTAPQTTPVVDGKHVYTLGKAGRLHCLNAKNGKLVWQKNIVKDYQAIAPVEGFAGFPVVEGDLLILATKGCGMALNKKTGKLVWVSRKPDGPLEPVTDYEYATPVIYDQSGRRHALIFHDRYLRSVDVETGIALWSTEWKQLAADPLVFDGKMLLSSSIGADRCALFDIHGDTPEELWSSDTLRVDYIGPVVVGGYAFGCDGGPSSRSPVALQCVMPTAGLCRVGGGLV